MTPHYVLIELERRPRFGWVSARQGRRLHIVLEDGSSALEPARHVLFEWIGDPVPSGTSKGALEQLQREVEIARQPPVRFDPSALHRQIGPGGRWEFERIVQELLGDKATGWQRARLFLALRELADHFRPVKGAFIARSETEMRQREARERSLLEQSRWVKRAEQWCGELESGGSGFLGSPGAEDFLGQLESLLVQETRSPYWKALGPALSLLAHDWPGNRARLKHWLQAAGRWRGWARIWLQAVDVSRDFDGAVKDASRRLAGRPLDRSARKDYRGLEAITLDSAGTKDFDDAISILPAAGDALEVAVHVADPGHGLDERDPLFVEAAKRASSVYTQEQVFPMLPEEISERRFSLLAGEDREAVTFRMRLEPGRAELLALEPSLVRVTGNLDYARGEARLADPETPWPRLVELCDTLTQARVREGARPMDRPEIVVDVSDPERLRLTRVDRHDSAHRVVEELAILVNREAGRFCGRHRLPAYYRVQGRDIARRRREAGAPLTSAAYFSLQPGEHAGLGVDAYVQVTSPLRRFADLVMQRQIVSQVTQGRPAHSDTVQLESWMKHIEQRTTAYQQLERRLDDYWKRRYLEQNPGLEMAGAVRHNRGIGAARVYLDEIQLEAIAYLAPGVKAGQSGRFKVIASDPDRESVEVVLVEG